jgi:hypothetical protein
MLGGFAPQAGSQLSLTCGFTIFPHTRAQWLRASQALQPGKQDSYATYAVENGSDGRFQGVSGGSVLAVSCLGHGKTQSSKNNQHFTRDSSSYSWLIEPLSKNSCPMSVPLLWSLEKIIPHLSK